MLPDPTIASGFLASTLGAFSVADFILISYLPIILIDSSPDLDAKTRSKAMSGVHNHSGTASDNSSDMMQGTAREMDMTHRCLSGSATSAPERHRNGHHGSGAMSHANMVPLGLLLVGSLVFVAVFVVRNSPIYRWVKGNILDSLFSKKTLGLGVFLMLTGGILSVTNQLKKRNDGYAWGT